VSTGTVGRAANTQNVKWSTGDCMSFSDDIQKHLIAFKENTQYLPPTNKRKAWEYLEVTDNLYPPIRHGFLQYAYEDSIAFHDYARHVRSSQVFCFNVVYPLIRQNLLEDFLKEKFDLQEYELSEWHFEYQPTSDLLGEWRGPKKPIDYITSVDFVAFMESTQKMDRIAIFIEVKFTEQKFSKCGGFTSNGNKNKKYCKNNFQISTINNECYLVNVKKRKYFQLTNNIYKNSESLSCPFMNNNQCQRNHAFAIALKNEKIVQDYYFCLLYHEDNSTILSEWQRYKDSCIPSEQQKLFEIQSGQLVGKSEDKTFKKYMSDRYQIKAT